MGYFKNFNRVMYDQSCHGTGHHDLLVNLTSSVKISDALIDNVSFYNYTNILDGERMEQLSYRLYTNQDYYWTFLLINKNIKNIWNDWPKSIRQLGEYCEKKYPGFAALIDPDVNQINSDIFIPGEVVYLWNQVWSRCIVRSTHLNNSYLVLEPIYWCDGGEGGTKQVCVDNGGKWSPARGPSTNDISTTDSVSITSTGQYYDSNGDLLPTPHSENSITAEAVVKHKDAPHHHYEDVTGNIVPRLSIGTTPVSHYEFEYHLNDINRNIKVIKPEYIQDIVKEFEKEIGK